MNTAHFVHGARRVVGAFWPAVGRFGARPTRLDVFRAMVVLLLCASVLNGCGFIRPDNLKLITVKELDARMQQGDILLIDVHVPRNPPIVGTDFHAPFYKIDDYAAQLPQDKNTPIYLYCKSGPMGNWAARTLFDMGYTQIYNLDGGTKAWKQAGFPVQPESP